MKFKKRYVAFGIILIVLIYFTLKFNYSIKISSYEGRPLNKDAYALLQQIKYEIQNGAAGQMQDEYPEGFVFMHALYALSWTNLLLQKEPPFHNGKLR